MPTTSSRRLLFGDGFDLDLGAYELRRDGRALKLPRIPMEVLLLLMEQRGNLVTREQIVERIWGKEIFVDTDNSINAAIRKIRRALRDDSEEPHFIQTVTGRGYRFIAEVTELGLSPPAPHIDPQTIPIPVAPPRSEPDKISPIPLDPQPQRESSQPLRAWKFWIAASAVALVILGFAQFYRARLRVRSGPAPAVGRVMLAVLPFENLTGDTGQEYFSDGMTEEMITDLGMLDPRHLGVIARTSVMLYKHTPKPVDQIGRELGVQYVMEGSVRRDSSNVRITVQLIQVKDQSHVWAKQYDRELKGLLALQAEIAQEVADQIRLILGDQEPTSAARFVPLADDASYESYDLYLKGRYYWNKRRESFEQAADYFQQAIAKDRDNSRAYAGLADTFALMSTYFTVPEAEYMAKARAAALKALELDDSLAEAHASLALILENSEYDWDTAEEEFRRAIQLNPDYATAHQWYAEHLAWRGRFGEAFAESERARQLDPLSVIIAADHCKILYFSRQYDRAIAHCRTVLEMDPRANGAQGFIFSSLVEQGKFAEAEQQITLPTQNIVDRAWVHSKSAYLYGRWGRMAEARQFLARVEQHRADFRHTLVPAMLLAYCGAGTSDQVMALLEKAYAQHSNVLGSMKVDPMYDRFRADPRFQQLLHRVGLDR